MTASAPPIEGLRGSPEPLCRCYDAGLLDLDGVVYLLDEPIGVAPAAIEAARAAGMRIAFVTNNASRTPERVAERLTRFGVRAEPADVVTSPMAVVRTLQAKLPPGAAVLVVGGEGLQVAVDAAGFRRVDSADADPDAVVQGLSRSTTWTELAEAAVAVRRGALWIAANVDATMPTSRGSVPGNGALVKAVAIATGAQPLVVGKPETPLHEEAVRRTNATRPLVVGDRLDTDIEGAWRAGADSLLVLTGVTSAADVLSAPTHHRPTYLSVDLRGLLQAHPHVRETETGAVCRAWQAVRDGDAVDLSPTGAPGEDLDALRVLATLCWAGGPWRELRASDSGLLARIGLDVVR